MFGCAGSSWLWGNSLAAMCRLLVMVLLLWSTGFRTRQLHSCGSRALEHRLNSHGAGAQMLHGMWGPP